MHSLKMRCLQVYTKWCLMVTGLVCQAGVKALQNGDSKTTGGHSDEESEDLYGDNIDEENQRVERAASQGTASGGLWDQPLQTHQTSQASVFGKTTCIVQGSSCIQMPSFNAFLTFLIAS